MPASLRTTRSTTIPGPAGTLESIVEKPTGRAVGGAVVCHPHPLHGGTLHNKVVYRAAKGAVAAGLVALRFNFRGVGLSSGEHDGDAGEQADVRAALDAVAAQVPGERLVVAGFSFGAVVGLKAAAGDNRVAALIGLGLPTTMANLEFLLAPPVKPLLILQGQCDEFARLEDVQRLAGRRPQTTLKLFQGQGHFFDDVLPEITSSISGFCRQHVTAPVAGDRS